MPRRRNIADDALADSSSVLFSRLPCLVSCQAPNVPDSGGATKPPLSATANGANPESKNEDVAPVVPQSFGIVSDALVIVVPPFESNQRPGAALLNARNDWIETLRAAFEKRGSFGSVTLARDDTSNTVQRIASANTNACILFLFDYPAKSAADSVWMFMQHRWFPEMRSLSGAPPALWGKFDSVTAPYGRNADLLTWIERVEFLSRLPSFNHALAFSVIQQKPKKTGKYRVFQSLPGYSLCDQGKALDDLFCVEGLGRPFVADNTWFDDKTLIWCGTFTYDTKGGLTRTVERYALDLNTAISSLLRQTETPR